MPRVKDMGIMDRESLTKDGRARATPKIWDSKGRKPNQPDSIRLTRVAPAGAPLRRRGRSLGLAIGGVGSVFALEMPVEQLRLDLPALRCQRQGQGGHLRH